MALQRGFGRRTEGMVVSRIPPMAPSFLSQPVAVLARACTPVPAEDSVAVVARRLRESGTGIVPIVSDGLYAGAVTERSLAEGLARGVDNGAPVTEILDTAELRVSIHMTGAEALRLFADLRVPGLIVADAVGRVLGVLAPSDLYPRPVAPPRPPTIGGMATPFGVYLTTGVVNSGAGGFALVVTGMLLASLLTGAMVAAEYLAFALKPLGFRDSALDAIANIAVFAIFGAMMRILPLSKTHAAEHMVVHAIERGEELTPAIVKRMPRVHPRCGTNLAVGSIMFLLLARSSSLIPDETIRLLFALVVTVMFWRPIGAIAQRFVTTSPPREKHIEMGIRSGKELLRNYVDAPVVMPNIWQRIFNSGIFHVMLGSTIISGVVLLVARWLKVDF